MSLQSTYESRKALLVDNLETMGVTGYSENDGLTTLINAVLEIGPTPPTPTPASITLTADKSILSYEDTESAVLTATVLDSSDNPVEGVSVDLYKDSVLWDTLTTGSAGTVSKTYTSAGVGDVGFTAECGSLVTESFAICDAWKYDPQNYTSTRSVDISLPTGNFEITAKINPTSRTGSYAQITYGTDSNNRVYFGQGTASGQCGLYAKSGGSTVINHLMNNAIPLNTYSEIKYSYVDGVHTLKVGNETVTGSNSTISRTKIYEIYCTNNNFKELLIKPL